MEPRSKDIYIETRFTCIEFIPTNVERNHNQINSALIFPFSCYPERKGWTQRTGPFPDSFCTDYTSASYLHVLVKGDISNTYFCTTSVLIYVVIIGYLLLYDLRCHPVRSTNHRLPLILFWWDLSTESKICYLHLQVEKTITL